MNNNLLKFREYYKDHIDEVINSDNEEMNKKIIEEFNQEFPIERIKKLKLDEYIFKGKYANTFASRLCGYYNAFGDKKKLVGPSTAAGSYNMKFGIHYQNNHYIDYTSKKNIINNPQEYYEELNKQLVEVLINIKNGKQDIDYTKYDHLKGMYNVILKIAYYINPMVNITFGNKVELEQICNYFGIEVKNNDKAPNLSYRIKKFIDANVEETKNVYVANTCSILYDFAEKYIYKKNLKNNVWLFQIDNKDWNECKKNKKIILDILETENLKEISKDNDQYLANLNDFSYNMKKKDMVIVKNNDNELLGYGTIISKCYYDTKLQMNCRNVKWNKTGNWKSIIFSNSKIITNITEEKKYVDQLLTIINGENKKNNSFKGKNVIYYGVPGCGKSYKVNEVIQECDDQYIFRTVFHPEYTYSDFIGQVMPITENKKISYDRIPGPFTKALAKAYDDLNHEVFLIIEEINRGNAAAIFGDLFQLLDRNNYEIDNDFIYSYLIEHESKKFKGPKIQIPNNLTILATMNTSDQNVYTLDNAFRRRFEYVRVVNDFSDNNDSKELRDTNIANLDITWGSFVKTINDFIVDQEDLLLNNEDKRLGVYSITIDELNNKNKFADKVLFYLWDNIGKYNNGKLFKDGYKLYDSLIDDYLENKNIFCDELLEKLNLLKKNIENN